MTHTDIPDVHLIPDENGLPFSYALKLGDRDVTEAHPRPVHHAPGGVAWGYHGSGPADLALLVLHLHLPPGVDQDDDDVLRNNGFPPDPEDHAAYEARLVEEDRLDNVIDKIERDRRNLPVRVHGGPSVSRAAWDLHQTYKASVIAHLAPDAAHVLRAADVRNWLAERGVHGEHGAPQTLT